MRKFILILFCFCFIEAYVVKGDEITNIDAILHNAIENVEVETVKNILLNGFNLSNSHWLYYAINVCNNLNYYKSFREVNDEQITNSIEIVLLLLEFGADPNAKTPNNAIIYGYGLYLWELHGKITMLMFSRVNAVTELLIKYGADINDRDNYGSTALMLSAFFYDYKDNGKTILETFLNSGSNVNMHNSKGQTALHFAVHGSNTDAIRLLVNNGVNVNHRDNKGWTPIMLLKIIFYHDPDWTNEAVQILQNAGAIINDEDLSIINDFRKSHISYDIDFYITGGDR